MQLSKKTIYEKSFIGLTGTAWIAGLLIAGSDSQYMPWLNGIGLLLFFGASILLGKLLNPLHSNPGIKCADSISIVSARSKTAHFSNYCDGLN
ncbi:MAG: hypothetical protein K8S13_22435 [Desulfobacula sp.]|uniref:hypothetical protein n=1 Tax=Desulfobacula sp. TaxID=2593537 RepID=UPI0025C3C222|nr:hypothetical protein [Desulfobacula sp.]MCD4722589.1 hypothetical protein [Desulfobacula sp.]